MTAETRPPLDKQAATRRLTYRWREQVDRFPAMANEIPLRLYLRRNVPEVMRSGIQLLDYVNRA